MPDFTGFLKTNYRTTRQAPLSCTGMCGVGPLEIIHCSRMQTLSQYFAD